jgi:hypothetical protein
LFTTWERDFDAHIQRAVFTVAQALDERVDEAVVRVRSDAVWRAELKKLTDDLTAT